MNVTYDAAVVPNPLAILRKAGYSAFRDPVTHEESFTLRLTGEFYPRFHLYVKNDRNGDVIFSLHLDQRKASYGEGHAHSGEYDGATVEKEMRRIDGWVSAARREAESDESAGRSQQSVPTKKLWWWPF